MADPKQSAPDFIPSEPDFIPQNPELPEQRSLQKSFENPSPGKDILKGIGKGALNTLSGVSGLINKIPYIGETLAPSSGVSAMKKIADTTNKPFQEFGKAAEQTGEFVLPGPAEERLGAIAAEHAPAALRSVAAPLTRVAAGAIDSGAINKFQGGDFKTGALGGALGAGIGEISRAAAPGVAEGALGIRQLDRTYGKTPGRAILEETRGIRPERVGASAQQAANRYTQQVERLAAQHPGNVDIAPVVNDIDARIAQADAENNGTLVRQLREVRDRLVQHHETGAPLGNSATDRLNLKRGLRKEFVTNWNPERMRDVPAAAAEAGHGIDRILDTELGPDFTNANQRISSLIPAAERGAITARGPTLTDRIANRVARPTGGLASTLVGGLEGRAEGGVPGMLIGGTAGLVLPEMLTLPSSRMAAARLMYRPNKILNPIKGGALQLDRKREGER